MTIAAATLLLLAMGAPPPNPSAEDIIERLAAPPATTGGAGTRSLRNLQPGPRAIDLNIPFDFASANLTGEGREGLRQLALAMRSPRLASVRFLVEGHTDAKGAARYNLDLSSRRAASVVDYLRAQGISAERLDSVGKGFNELLNEADPLAAENRRVRVVALEALAARDAEPVVLVTEAELQASLAAPEPMLPRFTPEPGAPRILVDTPRPNAALSTPISLRLRFEPTEETAIRPETFKVKYGSLRIDITSRITGATEVTPQGVDISRASLPRGRHTLVITVEDGVGRINERLLRFEVL